MDSREISESTRYYLVVGVRLKHCLITLSLYLLYHENYEEHDEIVRFAATRSS